jgi:tetratricopeptide (TPR) repeat protein
MSATDRAIQTIEEYMSLNRDQDYQLINMLIDLYMASTDYEKALTLLDTSNGDLPIDILVNLGICELYLGKNAQALVFFEKLFKQVRGGFLRVLRV